MRPSTGLEATDANLELARDWAAAIRNEIRLGTFRLDNHFPHYRPTPARTIRESTFTAVAKEWLESHKQVWAEWTYRKFRSNLEARVFPKLGRRNAGEITTKDLRLFREGIMADGKRDGGRLSNRSVNRIMQPVVAIFNELFADGVITANPAARFKKLKEKRIAEIDPFAPEEIKAVLDAVAPWYRPYVEFLFESGFRLNEAMGLKWANVNMVTEIISVRHGHVLGKDKDPKTEAAIRDVQITPGMMAAIRKQRAISYLAHGYVFVTDEHKPLDVSNFRRRVWEPAIVKAGIKYRYPLQARHTFATRMIEAGRDPLWIADQMGTSLEMLFKHYAVYFKKKRWSQSDQTPELSTEKRPKPGRGENG